MYRPSREEIVRILRDLTRGPTEHFSYEHCYRKIYQYSSHNGKTGMKNLMYDIVPDVFSTIFLQKDNYLEYHDALTVLYGILLYPARVLRMTFENFRDAIRQRLICQYAMHTQRQRIRPFGGHVVTLPRWGMLRPVGLLPYGFKDSGSATPHQRTGLET